MARARATDHARTRPKTVLIDEITRGIEHLQDILTSIEDFSREGFPYRDAARAKAELQLRECVRRLFGERSSEFQTCRNYRLRTTSKEETAQSLDLVRALVQTLEDKKQDLQGIKAPGKESLISVPVSVIPAVTAVPATMATVATTDNAGFLHAPPQPGTVIPSITVSVPSTRPAEPSRQTMPDASAPIAPRMIPPLPSAPAETAPAPIPPDKPPGRGSSGPESGARPPANTEASSTPVASVSSVHTDSPAPQPVGGHDAGSTAPAGAVVVAPQPPSPPTPLQDPPVTRSSSDSNVGTLSTGPDALERLRKVCLRFHAVARQLRLRKDYRATLEVEDDYDLQDLLCALLKVEFEEVGTDEWTPPYAGGTSRTAFLLHGNQIAVVAKKTRPGLTATDLADQVTADSARYTNREQCCTLFCFIYDPEGRIGSPKRLETDLTSVSDRYMIDVLVAPK